MRRLYISFKSLVNDFVYSFGRAALLLPVEVWNHTVPVRERGRIRVKSLCCVVEILVSYHDAQSKVSCMMFSLANSF